MAAEESPDTARTTVKTYVPAYQRAEWDEHADELEMSRSEFVRTMVQAGRRGFGESAESRADRSGRNGADGSVSARGVTARSDQDTESGLPFENQVLEALERANFLSWERLVEEVTADIEGELETTLQELQADNRVRYSGPNGGYTIDE